MIPTAHAAPDVAARTLEVTSPDGRTVVACTLSEDGVPRYRVSRAGQAVVLPSRLGFRLRQGPALYEGFEVADSSTAVVDQVWEQVWGEVRHVRDHHHELRVALRGATEDTGRLVITFRVFDDGVGFRYEIPAQPGIDALEIGDELTEFHLTGDHRCWWIPAYQHDRYEYAYTDSPLSRTRKVHTPVTFETADGLYLSIHEAALTDFASMVLARNGEHRFEAELVPWSDGVKVRGTLPIVSPWRTIQIADTPGGLIESPLILNLNEPNRLEDTSWIEPGKYVGIWWEMHLGKSTWSSGPRHGATTENTQRYIDFAARHGFDGVLVEGWNIGWDGDWTANGDEFSFTQSYPDYDLEALAAYARERGVRLIGHHETAGDAENYERQLEDAFALCRRLGIRAVKTGYVAADPGIPRTDEQGAVHLEWHHGQYMVRHYRKVVETAVRYQVMLNVHEPIKDTGLRRTYPNMMTREGARGQEFNAWGGTRRNRPDHTTILPFTRLLAGPMDFTPGIFKLEGPEYRDDNRVSTTLAKQLALYVVLYSPLHMAADLPENYAERPQPFQFIKDVPTDWEFTRVLDAAIGDHVTIARKDRNSDDWYVGSITDEHARDVSIRLSFLDAERTYIAEIYRDGTGADWQSNPYAVDLDKREVTAETVLPLRLAPGGGAAIRITPAARQAEAPGN